MTPNFEEKLKQVQEKFQEGMDRGNNRYKLNVEEANSNGFFRQNKEKNIWHRLDSDDLFAATAFGFIKIGVISKSMGVNSKPTHKFYYKGFLVTIDGNFPEQDLLELKELIKTIDQE